MRGFARFACNAVTLQTPGGRIAVFVVLSMLVYVAPYSWLGHLSLWPKIGWHSAPSIGLTRAYWLLLHGDPQAAWHRNPLVYAVVAIGVPLLLYDVWLIIRYKRMRTGSVV